MYIQTVQYLKESLFFTQDPDYSLLVITVSLLCIHLNSSSPATEALREPLQQLIMPFLSPKLLLGLSALTLLLFNVSDVTASLFTTHKRSPKVLSFDFKKEVARNTPIANRLRKRQKTVTATIDNAEIAYVLPSSREPKRWLIEYTGTSST